MAALSWVRSSSTLVRNFIEGPIDGVHLYQTLIETLDYCGYTILSIHEYSE